MLYKDVTIFFYQILFNKKLKIWQNSKTQNVTKLKMGQNSICHKTQNVTQLKMWQNSKCDKTSKSQSVTKLTKTQNVKKEKIQMWPSSKTKNKTTQKQKL